MTHVTCRLTAKNRDQNPTLSNLVWATFTFLVLTKVNDKIVVENLDWIID